MVLPAGGILSNCGRAAAPALVLLLAMPTELRAQSTPLAPGHRVRISAPVIRGESFVGTVESLSADTLVVRSLGARLAVPLSSLETIEVSRGRASRARAFAWTGAGVGALAGLVLGAVGHASCESDSTCFFDDPFSELFAAALVVGGAGAALGYFIGSQVEVERWEIVPLDRIRVGLRRDRDALAVTGRIVF